MSTVKIVLIVLASVLGLCCLGSVVGGLSCYRAAKATMGDAEVYAQGAIKKIGKDWDADVLLAEGNATFRQVTKKEDAQKFLTRCKEKLGAVKEVGPISVTNIKADSTTATGTTTMVEGTLPVQFEKASGTAAVTVVKAGETWKLQQLNFNAPGL